MGPLKSALLLLLGIFALTPDGVKSTDETMDFLRKYGYLDSHTYRAKTATPEEDVKNALRDFQAFSNLEQTGELDSATVNMMKSPRCGMEDLERYAHTPYKWEKNYLTYGLLNYTPDLNNATLIWYIIRDAFDRWQSVANIDFQFLDYEYNHLADITIDFVSGDHGDGLTFDGPGNVYAHAFYPRNGRIHFDEDERWTDQSYEGVNLLRVAIHEIGHAIGLKHSTYEDSAMYAYIPYYNPHFQLHHDDITGIQAIYGARPTKPTTKKPTTTKPTTTKPTTKKPTTTKPTTKTTTTKPTTRKPTTTKPTTKKPTTTKPTSKKPTTTKPTTKKPTTTKPTTKKPTTKPTTTKPTTTKPTTKKSTTTKPTTKNPTTTKPTTKKPTTKPTTTKPTTKKPTTTKPTTKKPTTTKPTTKKTTTKNPTTTKPTTKKPTTTKPTTKKPTTTKPTTKKPTTRRTTSRTTTPAPPTPPICNNSVIHAITELPDGHIYVFQGTDVYKLQQSNKAIEAGYPKPITEEFPSARTHPHAVVTSGSMTYFLKKRYVYWFSGKDFERKTKIKKTFRGVPPSVNAAFLGSNGILHFLKGTTHYTYNVSRRLTTNEPIQTSWTNAPNYINAALRHGGSLYFFKGSQYYLVDEENNKIAAGYPKSTVADWFGCQ